jgi:hypothetical protein
MVADALLSLMALGAAYLAISGLAEALRRRRERKAWWRSR